MKASRERKPLTTVPLITQVPAVVVPVTYKAVVKAPARVAAEQVLAAICT